MDYSLMSELRARLSAYIEGRSDLQQFEAWFVPASWDAHQLSDPRIEQVRSVIEARIAEYTNGDWTEDELKGFLSAFVDTVVVSLDFEASQPNYLRIYTGSESSIRVVEGPAISLPPGQAPLLTSNPQILTSRPDALNDETERNPRQQLVVQV